MQAGRLRHRVGIYSVGTTPDGVGDPQATPTLTLLATVWADVAVLSGRELLLAQQAGNESSVRVRMRWNTTLTPRTVLRWTDPAGVLHTYDVEHVTPDPTHRAMLTALCSERP